MPGQQAGHPVDFAVFVAIGAPYALTGVLAALLSLIPFFSANASVPRGLIVLVGVQLAGLGVARANQSTIAIHGWSAIALTSSVLLPLLSLQVTLLREPYVSLARHSAGPAMFATFIVVVVLTLGAVWSLTSAWQTPEFAALLFMPMAVLVPAMMSMRETVYQRIALETLAETALLCAVMTAIAFAAPPRWRALIPAITLALEFVALWIAGRGPWFHATSGTVVRVLYTTLLASTVVLVVAVPVIAAWFVNRQDRSSPLMPDRAPSFDNRRPPRGAASRSR